eukprot:UN09787
MPPTKSIYPSKDSPAANITMQNVADQLMKSFENVFNVDVVTSSHVVDYYDQSLAEFNAQPRVWLRELESPQ